ncbi:MAG TPA: DEAD/DEAH box helicase [Candidatus Acidoferrales bacterium]|nr:DEAD/DEAH box helicase [Candidatus Acidoferrales bacterium]
MTSASPLDILTRVFGYHAFRSAQAAIIDQVVAGGDALVIMPTGGGKSLCYQVPALVRCGVGAAKLERYGAQFLAVIADMTP